MLGPNLQNDEKKQPYDIELIPVEKKGKASDKLNYKPAYTGNKGFLVVVGSIISNAEEAQPAHIGSLSTAVRKQYMVRNGKTGILAADGNLLKFNVCGLYGWPPSLAKGEQTYIPSKSLKDEPYSPIFENTFEHPDYATEAAQFTDEYFTDNIGLFVTPEVVDALASSEHYNIADKNPEVRKASVIAELEALRDVTKQINLINRYRYRSLVRWHGREDDIVVSDKAASAPQSLCQCFLESKAKELGDIWIEGIFDELLSESVIAAMPNVLKEISQAESDEFVKKHCEIVYAQLSENTLPNQQQCIAIFNQLPIDSRITVINACSQQADANAAMSVIEIMRWNTFVERIKNTDAGRNSTAAIESASQEEIKKQTFEKSVRKFANNHVNQTEKHVQTYHQQQGQKGSQSPKPQPIHSTFERIGLSSKKLLVRAKAKKGSLACATAYVQEENLRFASVGALSRKNNEEEIDGFIYHTGKSATAGLTSVIEPGMAIADETCGISRVRFYNVNVNKKSPVNQTSSSSSSQQLPVLRPTSTPLAGKPLSSHPTAPTSTSMPVGETLSSFPTPPISISQSSSKAYDISSRYTENTTSAQSSSSPPSPSSPFSSSPPVIPPDYIEPRFSPSPTKTDGVIAEILSAMQGFLDKILRNTTIVQNPHLLFNALDNAVKYCPGRGHELAQPFMAAGEMMIQNHPTHWNADLTLMFYQAYKAADHTPKFTSFFGRFFPTQDTSNHPPAQTDEDVPSKSSVQKTGFFSHSAMPQTMGGKQHNRPITPTPPAADSVHRVSSENNPITVGGGTTGLGHG